MSHSSFFIFLTQRKRMKQLGMLSLRTCDIECELRTAAFVSSFIERKKVCLPEAFFGRFCRSRSMTASRLRRGQERTEHATHLASIAAQSYQHS